MTRPSRAALEALDRFCAEFRNVHAFDAYSATYAVLKGRRGPMFDADGYLLPSWPAEPCTLTRGAYEPPAGSVGWVREVAVGSARCVWCGCGRCVERRDASHRNTVTPSSELPRSQKCYNGAHAGPVLARCVHEV